ncbi:hypothetical protein Bcell_3924 [Evansella cellulosilytica DSM 2522]|uniref:Uncharacterized protein n=1 Tax=Evansella cellulosilytica (strain ATCC 21833 / DSM 2522 / FERM P-1141 / JCM 9156 / N-4) TaxID=649639 RepID=E6TVN1_EVAC2|nr:hypothetical protein Bcell_3924 [Evansella cellulosilytica DSM 2522]
MTNPLTNERGRRSTNSGAGKNKKVLTNDSNTIDGKKYSKL